MDRRDRFRLPILALGVGCSLVLGAARARAVTDVEGVSGTGQNDSLASAQALGTLQDGGTLVARGWISLASPNDVDFYTFALPGSLGIFLDIDFAEDVGVASDLDVGLDSEIAVFDGGGHLLAHDDDSDFFEIGAGNQGTDPGSDPWGDHDPFIGELLLGAGTFAVAVSYYENSASATGQGGLSVVPLSESGVGVSGATPDTSFELDATCSDPNDPFEQCAGSYTLQIRTTFAPEPAPVLGATAAGLALAALGRRARAAGRRA